MPEIEDFSLKAYPKYEEYFTDGELASWSNRVLAWRETFEKRVREICTNLERENRKWSEEKQKDLNSGFQGSVAAYEELITFNKGRLFSLKQILGEL